MNNITKKIDDIAFVTDYVANGSFASLKNNVIYLEEPGYAILIRLTDYTNNWNGKYKYVSKNAYEFLQKSKVYPGDLIISNVGDPGKLFIVPDLNMPMTLGPNSILIRSKTSDVSIDYLAKYFQSSSGQSEINKIVSSTAQRKFNKTSFRNIRISLPLLKDQIRFTNLLSRIEGLIAKRKESIRLLDEFVKSTFLEMFGDPVRNEKGWKKVKFGDICSQLKYGTNKKSYDYSNNYTTPVLRIPNIINEKIDYNDLKYSDIDDNEMKSLKLFKDDILFVRTNGNPDYIARCAVFNDNRECVYASYLIRARLMDDSKMLPEFVQFCISHQSFRSLIVKQAKTTAGNYNINTEGIKSFQIIKPNIDLQNSFVSLRIKVEKIKKTYSESLIELEKLYGAVSQRAFGGEM